MKRPARILLVEDDRNLRRVVTYHLEKEGYGVDSAPDGKTALKALVSGSFVLILTDIRMPVMDGMELLKAVMEQGLQVPVVVMTAYGSIGDAVEAMRLGASDYLTKPVKRETLLLAVKKAIHLHNLALENRRLKKRLEEKRPQDSLLGSSRAIRETMVAIKHVAPSEATVLITGESGTGKELAARALHALSHRARGPFVAVNCAAVPKDLLETELFGHERGAFTGAHRSHRGKFEQAGGGTIFLDEVGDMAPSLQAKILRVLQERIVDPVGATASRPVDVRVVAATNRDLSEAVRGGAFREDLFWRLNVIPIEMPPLRERPEDVSLLFAHFYRRFGGGEPELTADAEERMRNYRWPGNVRELQNLCQRMAVLHPDGTITTDLLPAEFRKSGTASGSSPVGLWEIERKAILDALEAKGRNKSAAARALKIPRHVLLYRMKKYDIR